MKTLEYFEKYVNDRFGTSAPSSALTDSLPENSDRFKLRWAKVNEGDAEIFFDGSGIASLVENSLRDGEHIFIPVHPLEEGRWPAECLIESGYISISASYRTVFFEPEAGGILDKCADDGQTIMLKLHLEEPLPGIDGDRRLTRDKVQKCVALSTVLRDELKREPLGSACEIVPEFLGVAVAQSGVLLRQLPLRGVMPLFSLSSIDRGAPSAPTYIEQYFHKIYGAAATEAAQSFGNEVARPLVRSLLAGFRAGFSMEMHAQNVLIRPGDDSLIEKVFFRDLEGVVFSREFRARRGRTPLFENIDNSEIDNSQVSMIRWFNRNLDHDLGRVFSASLYALRRSGYFSSSDERIAIRSVQEAVRECVADAELQSLYWPGRLLPISRSPYGNGFSKGHYYRTRYR